MKERINMYIAALIITLAGAGAATLIIHIAYSNTLPTVLGGSEANYASLQQSILEKK